MHWRSSLCQQIYNKSQAKQDCEGDSVYLWDFLSLFGPSTLLKYASLTNGAFGSFLIYNGK